tara:strand:- start:453 stop:686 length:234 start_codon:yes stop_codon:yes gene_type:complete
MVLIQFDKIKCLIWLVLKLLIKELCIGTWIKNVLNHIMIINKKIIVWVILGSKNNITPESTNSVIIRGTTIIEIRFL